ncbi:MAG: hypothetical protein IT287_01700 [Bdellovibrionaceae bacterium]|nr:hypothetical protein [Pseudobdellovibrionaceae bacterium]
MESLCLKEYVSSFEAKLDFSAYYKEFCAWIQKSTQVNFTPPAEFRPLMSSGITEGFNDFYWRHKDRDLFVLRGEYPYHKDTFDSLERPLHYLDETPLSEKACVVLSAPFSASGAVHPNTIEILEGCTRLQIPVFMDFAFLGLGETVDVNEFLKYSCVDTFAFSYSKIFSLGRARAGWVWTKANGGMLHVVNNWQYTNWLGHFLALNCLRHFTFDQMYAKYAPLQQKICSELQLRPSPSFLFGLGDESYQSFSRQGTWNRVCLSQLLLEESRKTPDRTLDSSFKTTIG